MSASLRERLKKTRRSFRSPSNVAKRLKIDEESAQSLEEGKTKHERDTTDVNSNETMQRDSPATSPVIAESSLTQADMLQQRDQLRREVKEKMDILRRLNMVKMYRSKNDLTQLQELTGKWRLCAQAVLYELQTELCKDGRKTSLSQLMDQFGLEDGMLHFDRTEDDFTDS
ncbi:swi5-dependent recombination DNA repair protein 1 homolog [Chanos chanos]|uniref:Swi5-dependent recombination DNA repair protein 1 homolog n=1 Tax=Chanos chanos TaxID=29144 RepID=A0A6J2V9F7_CHACN|nr:swi5-dependent recombination DNA repair protein 1 homolog [Chanos chanos]